MGLWGWPTLIKLVLEYLLVIVWEGMLVRKKTSRSTSLCHSLDYMKVLHSNLAVCVMESFTFQSHLIYHIVIMSIYLSPQTIIHFILIYYLTHHILIMYMYIPPHLSYLDILWISGIAVEPLTRQQLKLGKCWWT